MSLVVKVYENGDHTCLVWFPADYQPIPDCRGFGIQRKKTGADGKTAIEFIRNYTGFSDNDKPPADPWRWPIQRFLWWDYFVRPGDKVQYQVVPVAGSKAQGTLQLAQNLASGWTPEIEVTGQVTAHLASYFNKGIIASQWVSRELDQEAKNQKSKKTALQDIIKKQNDPLRDALSGLLRTQILQVLADVEKGDGTIYAALYELNDPDLLDALKRLGSRVNLILGNGAFKPPDNDENAAIRQELKTNTKINVFDRKVSSGHFAHNKFVVVCDKTGKVAQKVITGSTNWTVTGLCTQANNALIIDDAGVAGAYRQQWDLLRAAGNEFPASLVQANSKQKTFPIDKAKLTVWFTPTANQEDLQQARSLIQNAKEGILFLFFNPGTFQQDPQKWTLLQSVLDRHNPASKGKYDPNLYIRGVVNQKIAGLTEGEPAEADQTSDGPKPTSPVELYAGGAKPPVKLGKDVLVPAAIKAKFGHWEAEMLSIGVMVHSKVIVIDPFGDYPVLMTGSHNLGVKASRANDDNLAIVEGPGTSAVATAYAVNIIAIFQEYRWRQYVAQHASDSKAWHVLQDDDKWQLGHLTNEKGEMEFWAGVAPKEQAGNARLAGSPKPPSTPPGKTTPKKKQRKPRRGGSKKTPSRKRAR